MDEKCLDCKDRVERDLTIGVLRMQRDKVLALHSLVAPLPGEVGAGQRWCAADGRPYPCPTVRIYGVTDD